MEIINLIDDFNQVSLHEPSKEIIEIYKHIDEINEVDPRGFPMVRPLFSHSDVGSFLNAVNVKREDFDWDRDFIYCVCLHHHNALAAKHLDVIPEDILEAVRKRKCKLILDNTLEGDRVIDFYTQLYFSCYMIGIPIDQVYYITNSLVAEEEHKRWKYENGTLVKDNNGLELNVISFMYNVHDIKRLQYIGDLPDIIDIDQEIKYKKANLDKVKHFLKVNRTGRPERDLFMLFINKEELYDRFLISYPEYGGYNIPPRVLPEYTATDNINDLVKKVPFDIDETDKTNHGDPGYGEGKFNADLPFQPIHYKNSFLSTVMCAFPFVDKCCHLHSSTFNPMFCGHPILQFGPYGHLEELKRRGFKTFDKWWDESYDFIEDGWERLEAVINITKELSKKSPVEMLEMYIEMKDVLIHNHNIIQEFDGSKFLINRIFNE